MERICRAFDVKRNLQRTIRFSLKKRNYCRRTSKNIIADPIPRGFFIRVSFITLIFFFSTKKTTNIQVFFLSWCVRWPRDISVSVGFDNFKFWTFYYLIYIYRLSFRRKQKSRPVYCKVELFTTDTVQFRLRVDKVCSIHFQKSENGINQIMTFKKVQSEADYFGGEKKKGNNGGKRIWESVFVPVASNWIEIWKILLNFDRFWNRIVRILPLPSPFT